MRMSDIVCNFVDGINLLSMCDISNIYASNGYITIYINDVLTSAEISVLEDRGWSRVGESAWSIPISS